ncbi:dihydroorotase [Guptibacillus algicola]|uniref:dihydroorotase n=1 Tax=Guptibacillus algicola TaxID=225844 RepID=UPI001CD38453|nr:dihydroorotase [Alkalihalobacillus algicola]MCA0988005.1 dihydroorotase [Alkalihalobacillus algicola]
MIIKNALLLNETGNLEKRDVLISRDGKVERISSSIESDHEDTFDAEKMLLIPGLVDLHVHLREPGGEHKETIETGTKAAAKGGFTTIAAMPNTRPVPDQSTTMSELMERIEKTANVRVLPYGSITIRQLGDELTNFEGLRSSGAFALTDDGVGVQHAGMMLEAMKRAASLGLSIVAHCEENTLINRGCVHEGHFSKEHDLNGIPSVCESVHIARDVLLAEAAGAHYHVCHISTRESVRTVRDAKRAGINVTAEVTPHHLLLSEEDIPGLDTNFKMNPPLRSKEDQKALIEGLLDGTIDFIATDHAPHSQEEKATSMEKAPFGIVGLETAFPLLYSNFVEKGTFTLKQLVDWLTVKPAEAFGLSYGTLEEGVEADLTLIDLDSEERIDPETFVSKGKNTPFKGWNCKGWPAVTYVNGKKVFEKGSDHE